MAISVIQLLDILNEYTEEEINNLLFTFTCKSPLKGSSDVENFLHNKALPFEKMGLARTYLVFSNYQSKNLLVGYFSYTGKSLVMPKKQFKTLSNNQQKRLMGMGHKTDLNNYEIPGFLLGQLGKNYSESAKKAKAVSGKDILALAYDKIRQAYNLSGGRILFLECEEHERLLRFYQENGFRQIEDYKSQNNLCLFVKDLKHV